MQTKLAGTITIPKGSYLGNGDAILFLQLDNFKVCDKVAYIHNDPEPAELQSDKYFPLQAAIFNKQAFVPELCIHYDLAEKD